MVVLWRNINIIKVIKLTSNTIGIIDILNYIIIFIRLFYRYISLLDGGIVVEAVNSIGIFVFYILYKSIIYDLCEVLPFRGHKSA